MNPIDLLETLAADATTRPPHEALREEVFPMRNGPLVLIRCRCGGLYSATGMVRHTDGGAS